MKTAGTAVPATGHACVVFAPQKDGQPSRAGVFGGDRGARASKLAKQDGLLVIQFEDAQHSQQFDAIAPGTITSFGQLRLRKIGPKLLNNLQAQYQAQASKPKKRAASGEGAPASMDEAGEHQPEAPSGSEPPGSPDLGPSLLAAYRQLDVAGRWFERMQAELADVLGQIGKASSFSFQAEAGVIEYDHYAGGDGWVIDGWRWCFPARHGKRRTGDLSVVVDLGRPGRPASALGTPCLLVLWSSPARDWGPSIDAGAGFWPPLRNLVELTEARVFRWIGSVPGNGSAAALPWKDGAWYYIVELAGMSNMAALRAHVVQPALALLAGKTTQEAFAKAPAVMRFRQHQGTLIRDAKPGR